MSKIDTTQWKDFVITEFIEPVSVKNKLSKLDLIDNGVVPVHSSETLNNGIIGFTDKDAEFLVKQDEFYMIFGDHTKSINIAEYNFCVMDNVKVLKPKIYNKRIIMYIMTVWKKSIPELGYARHWVIAKNVKFKLPVDINGNPNFAYMEQYMQNLESAVSSSLTALRSAKSSKTCEKLDVASWGKFEIGKLFEIRKGKRLTKANMVDGEIHFIGASSFNNGITAYIGNTEHLHSKNTITMSYNGSVGEAFYQEEPFWASDDVNVLYPKIKFNRDIAMFIIPLLKKAGQKYAFIDKWKKEDMEKDCIYLPVNTKKEIDFNYIEDYIQNKCLKIDKSLSSIFAV